MSQTLKENVKPSWNFQRDREFKAKSILCRRNGYFLKQPIPNLYLYDNQIKLNSSTSVSRDELL